MLVQNDSSKRGKLLNKAISNANTIFLHDGAIKDSRNVRRKFSLNLSPAKIKENKVFQCDVVFERFLGHARKAFFVRF